MDSLNTEEGTSFEVDGEKPLARLLIPFFTPICTELWFAPQGYFQIG